MFNVHLAYALLQKETNGAQRKKFGEPTIAVLVPEVSEQSPARGRGTGSDWITDQWTKLSESAQSNVTLRSTANENSGMTC